MNTKPEHELRKGKYECDILKYILIYVLLQTSKLSRTIIIRVFSVILTPFREDKGFLHVIKI